jgi:hypothetical protein
MATVAAILNSETDEDKVIAGLDRLEIEGLDWRVYRSQEDTERIMPAVRLDGSGTAGATTQGAGVPLRMDMPEDLALEDFGIPEEEANFYAQSHARGATILVVETPSDHIDQVRALLREGGATNISDE